MKFVRFSIQKETPPTAPDTAPGVRWGTIEGERFRQLQGDPLGQWIPTERYYRPEEVRLLPPCCPSKIVCVGRNYLEHARELSNPLPPELLLFLKPPSALIASGDAILYPPQAARVDYEGELGLVIGRRSSPVEDPAAALEYVFGYTCVNDVTARDLQKRDVQFTRAKGFDTFCPVGPLSGPLLGARRRPPQRSHLPRWGPEAGRQYARSDFFPRCYNRLYIASDDPGTRRPDRYRHAGRRGAHGAGIHRHGRDRGDRSVTKPGWPPIREGGRIKPP